MNLGCPPYCYLPRLLYGECLFCLPYPLFYYCLACIPCLSYGCYLTYVSCLLCSCCLAYVPCLSCSYCLTCIFYQLCGCYLSRLSCQFNISVFFVSSSSTKLYKQNKWSVKKYLDFIAIFIGFSGYFICFTSSFFFKSYISCYLTYR